MGSLVAGRKCKSSSGPTGGVIFGVTNGHNSKSLSVRERRHARCENAIASMKLSKWIFQKGGCWGCVLLPLFLTVTNIRLCAEESGPGDITLMEKVIVDAAPIDKQPRASGIFGTRRVWLHVAFPHYEILSLCDSTQTLAVARHLADSLDLDREFVPPIYRSSPVTPMTFIMFDHEPSKAMEALVPNANDIVDSPSFGIYHDPFAMAAGGIDIADSDTHCAVQNRHGMAWAYAGGGLGHGPIPTGLKFEISHATPAMPDWYQYGFIGPCGLLRIATGSNGVFIASPTWVSEAETKEMLAKADKTKSLPSLLPIQSLFRLDHSMSGPDATDWPSPEWMAEAALFLHWGFFSGADGSSIKHRQAFEAFLDRSRHEPVTESMFRECFGFGFAEMQLKLSRFLVEHGREPLQVDYDHFVHWAPHNNPDRPAYSELECEVATDVQVARILGDWERMEGNAKRPSNPALSALFFKRAGITLHRCYDEGERDPSLLAVLGLYDVDIGAFPEGEAVLQEATNAGVSRPATYVALARLRLKDAREHSDSQGRELSADQLAKVLRPLFAIRKQAYLNAEGYRLIAEAWSQSKIKPTLPNLAVLQEGLELYPFDANLILSTTQVYFHWGFVREARSITTSKLTSVDAQTADQLSRLMAASPPRSSGAP
jgi:hypothetical protein